MLAEALIIVVGGDDLAFEVCAEILKTSGHEVALVWKHDDERAERRFASIAERLEAEYGKNFRLIKADAADGETLRAAGLRGKEDPALGYRFLALVAVSPSDRQNLRIALAARDINDSVRVTIRQFNPLLGQKIQEGLRSNCTAISPAAHAAATYAAAAVDPSCRYAMPFPTLETLAERRMRPKGTTEESEDVGEQRTSGLFGFAERSADEFGVVGLNVEQAERRIKVRIVSVNDRYPYLCAGELPAADSELIARPLEATDRLVAFGSLRALKRSTPQHRERAPWEIGERFRGFVRDIGVGIRRTEPILQTVTIVSLALFVLFTIFFSIVLKLNPLVAMYYVTTTMTTVGYGDITPCQNCGATPLTLHAALGLMVAMSAMLVGIFIFAVFTATITSTLNAAQIRRLRGLRQIHRSGHIIVCGSGNVGSLVIDYLRELDEKVVVIEKNPDTMLIELARDHKVDLLTGDVTNDETIAFSSPERAKALVGVTNSDTANLEAALGARSRSPGENPLHVVLRVDDLVFGDSIRRHFGIASFSTSELTAATIAGLARFESTRGRFEVARRSGGRSTYQLAERVQGPENKPPPSPPDLAARGESIRWIPLFVWRESARGKGMALPIHNFAGEVEPGDRLLFMVPLDQFVVGAGKDDR
ncbi:MAG TPA: NAD-binding protein [Candidatus Dormibacteraeota bacterium]|nr:NAD-binding protein [Candidatus Dormibacteraeota bacterium]